MIFRRLRMSISPDTAIEADCPSAGGWPPVGGITEEYGSVFPAWPADLRPDPSICGSRAGYRRTSSWPSTPPAGGPKPVTPPTRRERSGQPLRSATATASISMS